MQPVDQLQRRTAVSVTDGRAQLIHIFPSGQSRGLRHHISGDVVRPRNTLIQQRQRVAHAAVRQTRQQQRRVLSQRKLLMLRHLAEPGSNVLRRDPAEVKPLTARKNRGGNPVRLGRRQNKHDMLRRLLQRLEQCIERTVRHHVHLIDDVHPVAGHGGHICHFLPQLPDIVHAVVGGGIHLHHVEHRAVIDAAADLTFSARITVHGMQAVDGLGQNLGAGGFPRSARADKQIRMGQASRPHLVFQRRGHIGLPYDLRKGTRSPFPIQHLIHCRSPPPSAGNIHKISGVFSGIRANRLPCGTRPPPLNAARFPA